MKSTSLKYNFNVVLHKHICVVMSMWGPGFV